MTDAIRLAIKKQRRQNLALNGKNVEGQGVLRRLDREIRNLERKVNG